MKNLEHLIESVKKQESDLQFDRFSISMAHELGAALMKQAVEERLAVAIDITRNGHRLFHVALEGSTPDNEVWIERKKAVVNRFGCSSFRMGLELERDAVKIEQRYLIPECDYAPHGGSFPIIIRDTGVIGTITVSGLPSEEDHQLVVDVLSDYLT